MNKNVSAIILIVLAALAIWWGWGKMKPYIGSDDTTGATETLPAEATSPNATPATQP